MRLRNVAKMSSVCGLECESCEILNVPNDPKAARSVADWFREMGWLKDGEGVDYVVTKAPYCLGCKGDRGVHWSDDCWILKCCVDERQLDNCGECDEFPCERLQDWSRESESYSQAFSRLIQSRTEG